MPTPDLERELGTRHRAAIGLSAETDAIVIAVSEETGNISLATGGDIIRGLDATALNNMLQEILGIKKPEQTKQVTITKNEDREKANT